MRIKREVSDVVAEYALNQARFLRTFARSLKSGPRKQKIMAAVGLLETAAERIEEAKVVEPCWPLSVQDLDA